MARPERRKTGGGRRRGVYAKPPSFCSPSSLPAMPASPLRPSSYHSLPCLVAMFDVAVRLR